jgi:hypothetical protein
MLIFWPFCFLARRLDAVTLGCVLNFAPVTGCWKLEAGSWLWEAGYLKLVAGYWKLVAQKTDFRFPRFQFPVSSF